MRVTSDMGAEDTTGRAPSRVADPLRLVGQLKQFSSLDPEATKFFAVRLVLVHPHYALLVRLAGLVLLASLPVGHCQEEAVLAVAAFHHLIGLFERLDGSLDVAGPQQGHA